jgi:hypothetical protein
MYTYKFRLFFDEVEDFVRDFELLADQTFMDFHYAIIQSINGLDGMELASFYVCDTDWSKIKEITLLDMEDKDEGGENQERLPRMTMAEAVLSDLIDDPHQRLIYEYDFLNLKTFFIELVKSSESDSNDSYPRCVASIGQLPKQANLTPKDEFDFSDLREDGYEEDDEMEDFYSEEDLAGLHDDIEF